MNCELIAEWIGPYLDDEATAEVRHAVEEHVRTCTGCAAELCSFRQLAALFPIPGTVAVPPILWDSIEHELNKKSAGSRIRFMPRRRAIGVAATVLFAIGLGLYSLPWEQGVEAATVDFGVLLDELKFDPGTAFSRFLGQYQAREIPAAEAERYGRGLSFDLPEMLPGGFGIDVVYALQFNDQPGVAARYSRGGEFLGVIFHPPVLREDFGTHSDRECVVGKHHGHAVEIGEWSLVHVTDATTCHCVLSRLDQDRELPAVLAAVAPGAGGEAMHSHEVP